MPPWKGVENRSPFPPGKYLHMDFPERLPPSRYGPRNHPLGELKNHAPNCENPSFMKIGSNRRLIPCKVCYSCRRVHVRRKQGQLALETAYPLTRYHAFPEHRWWLTPTYDQPPMTEPVPHELGVTIDPRTGKVLPYQGPYFYNVRDGRARVILDGKVPTSGKTGRPLTPSQLIDEHVDHLVSRYGWNSAQVEQWAKGTYESVPTLRRADMQKYLKRVKTALRRASHPHVPRYGYSGEYGGMLDRPHYHLWLAGIPAELLHIVYEQWEKVIGAGFIYPSYMNAMTTTDGMVFDDKAAKYQNKDLAKGGVALHGTPALLARENPFVQGCTHPALGERYYPLWLESIQRKLDEAIIKAKNDLQENWTSARNQVQALNQSDPSFEEDIAREYVGQCWIRALRREVKHFRLNNETFPTTLSWQHRALEALGMGQIIDLEDSEGRSQRRFDFAEPWRADTIRLLEEKTAATDQILGNPKVREKYDEHIEICRNRSEEANNREQERIARKRQRVLATRKLGG